MKKITYICDKCSKEEAELLLCLGEKEGRNLWPVANQEWCSACVEKILGREVLGWPSKSAVVEKNGYEKLNGFYI